MALDVEPILLHLTEAIQDMLEQLVWGADVLFGNLDPSREEGQDPA